MNGKTNIDIETLKTIYAKYKQHIIYGGVIFVCLLVVLFYTIPQFSSIQIAKDYRESELKRLDVLKSNLSLLQNLDTALLDKQFVTASSALPSEKNFEGIVNALSSAAAKSGVILSDYSLSIGAVSDDKDKPEEGEPQVSGYPFISLKLSLRANPSQLITFLKNLSETFPLSEVTNISQSQQGSSIDVNFYYKTYVPSELSDYSELSNLSQNELSLMNSIASWGNQTFSIEPVSEEPTQPVENESRKTAPF